ncbi:sensor histidine kinase [Brevundimonas sp. SL130]|uniref:sensor histidine kinase n=1 Tax=Brevundimonas sp. SL130 TaxID=2995143 RepID=UPI00226C942F|nr:ATP-binding protein [Brevundimonas sp. SL130]WAC60701.1 ATP-binding protein [Brevundimonas sp. SL130]
MRRMRPPTVLLQVALIAVVAVIATQLTTMTIVVLAPAPRPAGYTLAAASSALQGAPAKSEDGRPLRRSLKAAAPFEQERDPLAEALSRGLASELGREVTDVHVRMDRAGRPLWARPPGPSDREPRDPRRPLRPGEWLGGVRFGITSNQIAFPPFRAAVRMNDGQWSVIAPPRGGLAPWQIMLLTSMLTSLVVLSPLIWWMSQRLARPIRRFAHAAERLGADPDAPPLKPTGPNEVRLAITAFNDMQAKLREHIERRTHTVAAIAHDLRTPLTRLRFRIEMMPPEQQRQAIRDIEEMDQLVAQAMQFVKGQFDVGHAESLDFGELVQDMAERYTDTGAHIVVVAQPGLEVCGDPGVLRRGLSNLLDNAIAHAGAVTVRVEAADGRAVARIQDSGPGIPEADLERVFEPFFRLEASRNRTTGGAGLGLSIARHAVRAHGGDLTLANAPEGGLVATLSLPLIEAEAA